MHWPHYPKFIIFDTCWKGECLDPRDGLYIAEVMYRVLSPPVTDAADGLFTGLRDRNEEYN